MAKIYLASSWRNPYQADVLKALRDAGHDVYDFKNPTPGNSGFSWAEIDPHWELWDFHDYREALKTDIAQRGFAADFRAMQWADTFVLLWPSGRSAHLEYGWACGAGKRAAILAYGDNEPELMIMLGDFMTRNLSTLLRWLSDKHTKETSLY